MFDGSIIPEAFAASTQVVFYAFAGVMAVAFGLALVAMPGGKVEEQVEEDEPPVTGGEPPVRAA